MKTVRYSIERFRLISEINESKLIIRREQERKRLQTSIPEPQTSVTAQAYGQKSLRESGSETYHDAVKQYEVVLNQALEERAFKIDHGLPEKLRTLATLLGDQRAMPRDVVELHSEVLTSITKNITPAKSAAFNEEARYLLIALLGNLCSWYRSHCSLPSLLKTVEERASDTELSGIPVV